jgi:hypothetical protein
MVAFMTRLETAQAAKRLSYLSRCRHESLRDIVRIEIEMRHLREALTSSRLAEEWRRKREVIEVF